MKTITHAVKSLIISKIYLNISGLALSLDEEIVKHALESALFFFNLNSIKVELSNS